MHLAIEIHEAPRAGYTVTAMRVKICGITRSEDIAAACRAGADFVGINFYPRSRRHIGNRSAADPLLAAIEPPCVAVAVTVNPDEALLESLVAPNGAGRRFPVVQLHGDEPGSVADRAVSGGAKVIKAFRVDGPGFAQAIGDWMETLKRPDGVLAVLLDAVPADPNQYGGTGRKFDWSWVARARDKGWLASLPPMLLAGGLTVRNVGKAVELAGPWGVDVAGGVEVEGKPGIKSVDKIRDFIRNARVGGGK